MTTQQEPQTALLENKPLPETLKKAYNPQSFREMGHLLVDQLADYLEHAESGPQEMPVLPAASPEVMLKRWDRLQQTPFENTDFNSFMSEVLTQSNHLHHPHYVGHQVSVPLPVTALCEMTATLLNNGSAIYEMGPVNTIMEKHLIRWMGNALGYGPTADGFFTSGGSLGNLTALLAARQVMAGHDLWQEGNRGEEQMTALISDQAHYSLQRAVQILGWGKGGLTPVPLDSEYRMDVTQLEATYQRAVESGKTVVAVIGNACSTATGSYDPLEAIADFCQSKNLWFHVDGAHGASAAFSEDYRPLLKGAERADSVIWDAHKMMMMPALITAVLFKNGEHSYEAFSQKASYLFEKGAHEEWYNLAHRTAECTKRMMGMKLYASLALYGESVFSDFINQTYGLARQFAEMLQAAPDFELAIAPQSNIVCFRYVSPMQSIPPDALNALQAELRKQILHSGEFYLVQTQLQKRQYLRVTLMNPFTTVVDLAQLLETIRVKAQNLHP